MRPGRSTKPAARNQPGVTKREQSTDAEVGKKGQAKKTDKTAGAKATTAKAEGKKDQKRDTKEKKSK